jgi:protein TonB
MVERSDNQKVLRSGILTIAGGTLLPMDSVYIRHDCFQRFFVETIKRPQKMGLFNAAERRWIFPMLEQNLMKTGPKEDSTGAIFSRRNAKPELYDASGRQIAEGISIGVLRPARVFVDMFKNEHRPGQYFIANKNATENGLFANDGRMIVPILYSKIEYAAETHPVIVEKSMHYGDPNPVFNAYDLKTGQKIFANDFQELLFTANPRRFIARKKEAYGIVEIGKEGEAQFEFDRLSAFCKPPITVFSHFLFWARKGDKYYIIGADGSFDKRLVFDDIYLPDAGNLHFEKFKAKSSNGARLVALGRRREQPKGFFYIDERGGQTFIADPAMDEMPAPSTDDAIESVVIEEPPMVEVQKSTARPPLVEKPFDVPVSKMPAFPGGDGAILRFYKEKMRYPAEARAKNIQGNVFVEAFIETEGTIKSAGVYKDIGGACGEEAIRLINAMPKWAPAQLNVKALRLKVKICVPFELD